MSHHSSLRVATIAWVQLLTGGFQVRVLAEEPKFFAAPHFHFSFQIPGRKSRNEFSFPALQPAGEAGFSIHHFCREHQDEGIMG